VNRDSGLLFGATMYTVVSTDDRLMVIDSH